MGGTERRDGQHQPARSAILSRSGTALQQTVPNPFFGIAEFGNLSKSATITRGQLLRPFPQFGNILMHRVNEAKARYNAMVTRWQKRMSNGYSVDVNYTFSRLNDNQWGESNSFSNRQGSAMDNYDIDEYGVSLLDVAHRVNFSATFQLPFGEGRKWVNDGGVSERAARRLEGDDHRPLPDRVPASTSRSRATTRACSAATSGRTWWTAST